MGPTAWIRENTYKWLERGNRAYHTRLYTRDSNPDGIDVFAEDWDVLAILDACRYEALSRYELPGRLESRQSKGSMTVEFLRANFLDRDLTDTVYVTATPQLHRVAEESEFRLHAIEKLWEDEENFWFSEDGRYCIAPETTTEHALRVADEYPNKRLVIHYTQPHIPFMDPATDALRIDGNPYSEYVAGRLDVTPAELRESYYRNLKRALPHVEELLEELEGKTVISADHGHLLGERVFPIPVKMWSHPHGIYVDELVTVPWLVHESGERREIVAEPPAEEGETVDFEVVRDRLDALGYTE